MRKSSITVFCLLAWFYLCPWKNTVAQTANSWTVPLRIQVGSNTFNLYLGVRPNSTAGFDFGIDTLAAPPPPATPYAYFPLLTFPNFLQADYRGVATSDLWNLRIVYTGGVTYTVSWNVSQVPSSIPGLFIVSTRDTVNMRQTTTKTYAGDQSLKISFPTPVSVKSQPAGIAPEAFGLRSYPNPFASTTALEISLPVSRPVVVLIFNLLGQEIRAFRQTPMAPGQMTIYWDGLDQRGVLVPVGVYFCRVETAGASLWRKLYRTR